MSALTPSHEPGKEGLLLNLPKGGFRPLRAARQGLNYWDLESQDVILQALGRFLPRVSLTEDEIEARFRLTRDGKESCSHSKPLAQGKGTDKRLRGVDKEEIQALEQGLSQIEAKLSEPHLTPDARKLLEHFQLPDPEKLPDFYRLDRGRLLILWGCERSPGDHIPAHQAISKLNVDPWWKISWRRLLPGLKWLLLLLLLAGLAALLFLLLQDCSAFSDDGDDTPPEGNEHVDAPGPVPIPPEPGPTEPTPPPPPPTEPPPTEPDPTPPPPTPEPIAPPPEDNDTEEPLDPPPLPPAPPEPEPTEPPPPPPPEFEPLEPPPRISPEPIDSETRHATTLAGFSHTSSGTFLYLSEPDDNPGNRHRFTRSTPANLTRALVEPNTASRHLRFRMGENVAYLCNAIFVRDANATLAGNPNGHHLPLLPDLSQNAGQPNWPDCYCFPTSAANVIWRHSLLPGRALLHPATVFRKNDRNSAANALIAGEGDTPAPGSLAQRMDAEGGTTTTNGVNGLGQYLSAHSPQLLWKNSTTAPLPDTPAQTLQLLKDEIRKGAGIILCIKLQSPPAPDEETYAFHLLASLNPDYTTPTTAPFDRNETTTRPPNDRNDTTTTPPDDRNDTTPPPPDDRNETTTPPDDRNDTTTTPPDDPSILYAEGRLQIKHYPDSGRTNADGQIGLRLLCEKEGSPNAPLQNLRWFKDREPQPSWSAHAPYVELPPGVYSISVQAEDPQGKPYRPSSAKVNLRVRETVIKTPIIEVNATEDP